MRRRVKEQLKKMGGLEYWDVNFIYSDREAGGQILVTLPEGGSGLLISGETLPAGSIYTIGRAQTSALLDSDTGEPGNGPTDSAW